MVVTDPDGNRLRFASQRAAARDRPSTAGIGHRLVPAFLVRDKTVALPPRGYYSGRNA
jgi:hypothetical protein